ncbi:MAG TPA: winged helix-turn-helix domain-containing protein, partial [Pyrinomonadaceae bacterium]
MIEENRQVYEFDEFRVDAAKRQLLRQGEVVPLYSKAFDLLLLLVQSGGRDLSKDQILETVWPGQILEESNLTVNISAVRRALGEKAARPRYLITIPGRGYRFVANLNSSPTTDDGLVIETQTISEIIIEEETDAVDEAQVLSGKLIDASEAAPLLESRPRQLSAARGQGAFRRPAVLLILSICVAALIVAALYVARAVRLSRVSVNRFQQIKLRQLTNDGQVDYAAISPDGKFYAYTNIQRGLMSLHLGSLDGQTSIELREPALITYRCLQFAPDGRSIYYVMTSGDRNILYRIATLGGVPVKLREDMPWFFSIAPDNLRVAFLRYVNGGKNTSVVISNVDGSNERAILTAPLNRNMTSYCLA